MPFARDIDLSQAIFLAGLCREAYTQFASGGAYNPPPGYGETLCVTCKAADRPELFGFVLRSSANAVAAFRGTVTDRDWLANAEFFQTAFPYAPGRLRTHDGFTDVYQSFRDEAIQAVRALPVTAPLYVTGHSLGGAIATLLALDIAVNLPPRKPVLYTFGCPRVGNPLFATAFNREIFGGARVVNVHDIVPRLPPSLLPLPESPSALRYAHVQREFTISVQTGTVRGNHDIETYIEGMSRLRATTTSTNSARLLVGEEAASRRLWIGRRNRLVDEIISRRRPG